MRRLTLAPLALLALLMIPAPANATLITYTLSTTFSGSSPTGAPVITLNDFNATGSVTLTIRHGAGD